MSCNDGLLVYPDGSYRRGRWMGGEMHGFGVFVARNGFKYEGNWKDDMPNGKGV